MRCSLLLVAISAALTSSTSAAPTPSREADIATWADAAGWRLTAGAGCGRVEAEFGAIASTCWDAKARTEQAPKGSHMFPRIVITLASYADDARAKARMARFTKRPTTPGAAELKAYPLRAGFRVGARVVVVTTDALAFQGEMKAATIALTKALGGSELVCWGGCQ